MQETQTLAKFVADTGYADLPPSLDHRVQDRHAGCLCRRFRGLVDAVGAARGGNGARAGRRAGGVRGQPAVADRRLARRARQRRHDRRFRVRAAHGLPRRRHGAPGRARREPARAPRRQGLPALDCGRVRGFRAPAEDRRGTGDQARLSQPRRAGAVRRRRGRGQALRLRCRNAGERAGACRLLRRGPARVRLARRRYQARAPRPRRARWGSKARCSRRRDCMAPSP